MRFVLDRGHDSGSVSENYRNQKLGSAPCNLPLWGIDFDNGDVDRCVAAHKSSKLGLAMANLVGFSIPWVSSREA